jgi:dihydropteroate synthase
MKITPLKIESERQAKELMLDLGVTREGVKILSPKSVSIAFKIEGISSWEANIIKQHLLSLGSDSAINRDALTRKIKTNTLIFGNIGQLRKLCEKLKNQPFKLREISCRLSFYLDNLFKKEFLFRACRKLLRIKDPLICGIVNLTPDSFSGDGLFSNPRLSLPKLKTLVLKRVERMVKSGAKIIDLGGESTRPFSKPIREEEEIKRVIPFLKVIRKEFKNVLISVDTYKYRVAREAAEGGADIINDITALRKSAKMASLIRRYKLGCVLMHMKGMPQTMQVNPKYKDVVEEIIDFFEERLDYCKNSGIKEEQIFIDPGIGFGKRLEDNFKIINELYKFKVFGLPLFLGLSRKSFIGKVLNLEVEERLTGTIAAAAVSLLKGANILRVHDVRETFQAIKIVSKIVNN